MLESTKNLPENSLRFDTLADIDEDVFRNIQAVDIDGDEFDDLSHDEDMLEYAKQAAMSASEVESPSALQYHAIDFIFLQTSWRPSRFGDGHYPIWYASRDLETSIKETAYYWQHTYIDAPQGFKKKLNSVKTKRTVYQIHCQSALIDLRAKISEHPALIQSGEKAYMTTQALGKRIQQESYPGLITHSAHANGENIAILNPKILTHPRYHAQLEYQYDFLNNLIGIYSPENEKPYLQWHTSRVY